MPSTENYEKYKDYYKKYYESNKERILQQHREYAKKYRNEEYILEQYRQRKKTYQNMLQSQQLAKEFCEKIKDRVGHVYN